MKIKRLEIIGFKSFVDKASLWTSLAFYSMPTQWLGLLVVFTAGIGLILSIAFVTMRDIQPMWAVITRLLFFLTPVFYVVIQGLAGRFSRTSRNTSVPLSSRNGNVPPTMISTRWERSASCGNRTGVTVGVPAIGWMARLAARASGLLPKRLPPRHNAARASPR
jgi:hypothetical protein